MLDAGRLDRRITIQRQVTTKNGLGEAVVSWQTFADNIAASIEPLQGREFWEQQQLQGEISLRVRIRYWPGVKPSMRVLYGERILDIRSVIDPRDQHIEMQLMCSEGVTRG